MNSKILLPVWMVLFLFISSCKENQQKGLEQQTHNTQTKVGTETEEQQAKIEEAMSAAPSSISAKATILDYPIEPGGQNMVLRKGTNGWTCRPDNPHFPGYNPMCVDSQMIELFIAIKEKGNLT